MIKAVIFDFGNVLCTFDMGLFGRRIAALAGIPEGRIPELMNVSYHLSHEYESGLVTSEEFYEGVSRLIGARIDLPVFIQAFTDIFTPIPSTFALVRQLKPSYRLGLLSNTNEWHFEHGIKAVDVFPLFDTVTLSYRVKAMKPDEKIYRDALARLVLRPDECVYIDDIRENADAASRLGMHGIRYTTPEALAHDLQSAGVDLTAATAFPVS